jgi:general secretion pathway protein E
MLSKTIAEILLEQKKITAAQKDEYNIAANAENISFEEYVRRDAKVSDYDLAHAFSIKFELPFVDRIVEKMADPDLLSKIPLNFLRKHAVMPVRIEEQVVFLTSDPFSFQPLDELQLLLGSAPLAIAPRNVIVEAVNRYYPLEGTKEMIAELAEEPSLERAMEFGEIHEEDILGMASEAPIIKLVNHILYQAVKRDASDIHIEPFEKEVRVRYRIDGVLYTILTPPKRVQAALTSRIKIMANLNIAEKRQPQDGRIQIKIADKPIDIRVSVLPVVFGERIVLRLLDKTKTFGALKALGLSKRDYAVLEESIEQPNGIVLITGPTGSGKTSTLYSILSELNKPGVNIVTVEDPVEYQMMGVGQVQVKEQIGLTFAAALRSILRQDPDIVMIGETRDQETAQIAVQAALTGHLVLSTLHTNSAAASITRLIDMGIEPFLIASTVTSIVAQRLVRRLCPNCKKSYTPDLELLKRIGLSEKDLKMGKFFLPQGCDECSNTGYRGRLAIFEIMKMTPAITRLTLERADTTIIQEQARKDGMTLLVEDGARKVMEGLTTIEEVLSAATL